MSYKVPTLNEVEMAALEKWANKRPQVKHFKNGATLELVFTPGGGIGTAVTALCVVAGELVADADITDYESW
jgi:hypothetical protein